MSINREECEHEGGEWVTTYRKADGTVVRPFCRKIGTRRDRNGNRVDKWKVEGPRSLFGVREYTLPGRDIEGTVKNDLNDKKVFWFVDVHDREDRRTYRVAEGTATNVGRAKAKVEEVMRGK